VSPAPLRNSPYCRRPQCLSCNDQAGRCEVQSQEVACNVSRGEERRKAA
jgi:hypothetical protein